MAASLRRAPKNRGRAGRKSRSRGNSVNLRQLFHSAPPWRGSHCSVRSPLLSTPFVLSPKRVRRAGPATGRRAAALIVRPGLALPPNPTPHPTETRHTITGTSDIMMESLQSPTQSEVIHRSDPRLSFRKGAQIPAADPDRAALARRRRRTRWARFVAVEMFAIGVMTASVLAGVSERFTSESLTPIFRVLPITAAVLAAILPILFFGDPTRRRG